MLGSVFFSNAMQKDSNNVTTFFFLIHSLETEEKRADLTDAHLPIEETFVPGHPHKDHTARPKIQSYPQTRRPAGGLSRPLPSPGKI